MKYTLAKRRARQALDAVEVRSSAVHGQGLFALEPLACGQVISDYLGRRIHADEVDAEDHEGVTYLFALSEGGYIDGRHGGNATRHLNHSCWPNCHAEEYRRSGGTLGVRIRTLHAVAQDEELFLDYSLIIDPAEAPGDYPCHCGAEKCRGTLVGSDSG